jgi:hypothetical protein
MSNGNSFSVSENPGRLPWIFHPAISRPGRK